MSVFDQRDDCKADRRYSEETKKQLDLLSRTVEEMMDRITTLEREKKELEGRLESLDTEVSEVESRLVIRIEELESVVDGQDSSSNEDKSPVLMGGHVRPSERKQARIAAMSNPEAIIKRGRGNTKE